MTKTVAITGGLGNLGFKLLSHLARQPHIQRLVALDSIPAERAQFEAIEAVTNGRRVAVDFVECDLADWSDRRWRKVVESQAEALVHFAYRSPFPDDTWDDAAVSYQMTLNSALASSDSTTVRRYVFATSNHVMGRYKDFPLGEGLKDGELTPDLVPGVGTQWHTGSESADASVYASHKWAGEQLCRALADRSARAGVPATTYAAIRIGWCQPGDNRVETLSGTGSHFAVQSKTASSETDRWFKEMWLSNRDFAQLFGKAVVADGSSWPDGFVLVNGMSDNAGMKWSLEATRRYLGYEPVDDVYAEANP
ncbi:MAG: NAD(P)-dependent oxidoreductase [Candidatus Latescibacterota bacterium]|nr:NAD(P)-dependent oxidoreductase [Candidatus Latescibacterota bacterium]